MPLNSFAKVSVPASHLAILSFLFLFFFLETACVFHGLICYIYLSNHIKLNGIGYLAHSVHSVVSPGMLLNAL